MVSSWYLSCIQIHVLAVLFHLTSLLHVITNIIEYVTIPKRARAI